MSRRLIHILLAVSVGLNVGVVAMTILHRTTGTRGGPPPGPGGGARPEHGAPPGAEQLVEGHLQGMTRHLDLDPGQQEAIRAVMERHAPQLMALQREVTLAGQRLSEAYAAPVFDTDRFERLTADTGAARARLDSLSAVMLVQEAAVLTPQQRRAFAAVAPSIHTMPQRPPGDGGPQPPPRNGGPQRPPGDGGPPR